MPALSSSSNHEHGDWWNLDPFPHWAVSTYPSPTARHSSLEEVEPVWITIDWSTQWVSCLLGHGEIFQEPCWTFSTLLICLVYVRRFAHSWHKTALEILNAELRVWRLKTCMRIQLARHLRGSQSTVIEKLQSNVKSYHTFGLHAVLTSQTHFELHLMFSKCSRRFSSASNEQAECEYVE